MTGSVSPVGTIATLYVATGTTRLSDSPLAMFANRTLPFTRMSAGGTAATCATVSDALPLGTAERSFLNTVTSGLPELCAGRCTTTSQLELALTEKVRSRMTSPSEVNVTFRLPAATLDGPATSAVLTPFATESPSTETSSTLPGKPWTTNISAESAARSEEHTSELQSHSDLVCRLLLEKKKKKKYLDSNDKNTNKRKQIK